MVSGLDQSPLVVQVVRTMEDVEALRDFWTTWKTHRDSDIDFYRMIVESCPEALRPHVITASRNGQIRAILVGRYEEKPISFGFGYFRGGFARVRCLTFVYGAIHGDTDPECTGVLVDAVRSSVDRGEADIALFEFIPTNNPLFRLSLRRPGFLCRDIMPAEQIHRMMTIPQSIDDVFSRMSSKHRKNLRREIRQLFAHPEGARIVCYKSESEIDDLFRDAEKIAQKTYQRGLGAGFADTPQVRERLTLGAQKNWLRANILYLGTRPVAFWIGMLYDNSFVSEYMGYDPEYRQWSPGMVLVMRVIEGFCSRAGGDLVKELDFGLGDAEYKATLCTQSWTEASVYIFSRRPKGVLLKGLRATSRLLDRTARRALSSTSLLPKLKRSWRNRLSRVAQRKMGPVGA